LVCVNNFKRCEFGLGGAGILAGLVEMAFGHLCGFRMPMKLLA
jgi:hypothetical protein